MRSLLNDGNLQVGFIIPVGYIKRNGEGMLKYVKVYVMSLKDKNPTNILLQEETNYYSKSANSIIFYIY